MRVANYQHRRPAGPPYELSVGIARDNRGRDRDLRMALLPFRLHNVKIELGRVNLVIRGAHGLRVKHNQSSVTQPCLLECQLQRRLRRRLEIKCDDHWQPRPGIAGSPIAGNDD